MGLDEAPALYHIEGVNNIERSYLLKILILCIYNIHLQRLKEVELIKRV
jgi:hypothetical protein